MKEWIADPRIAAAKINYFYVKDADGKLRKTIAYIVNGKLVHIGLAFKHPIDQFARARGKAIAGGRAQFLYAKALGLVPNTRQGKDNQHTVFINTTTDGFVNLANTVLGAKIEQKDFDKLCA